MSVLSDKFAEANASVDDALDRMQRVVAVLQPGVAGLQADFVEGAPTADDLAASDLPRDRIDARDPITPPVLPERPAEEAFLTPEV